MSKVKTIASKGVMCPSRSKCRIRFLSDRSFDLSSLRQQRLALRITASSPPIYSTSLTYPAFSTSCLIISHHLPKVRGCPTCFQLSPCRQHLLKKPTIQALSQEPQQNMLRLPSTLLQKYIHLQIYKDHPRIFCFCLYLSRLYIARLFRGLLESNTRGR